MVASQDKGPIAVILGSTGAQGGSVVSALLGSSKPYQIHAVTRDKTKPSALALEKKGCTVVEADLGDADSLKRVVKGAQIVFAVTDFWQHMSKDQEMADGKRIIDAAAEAGVELFCWSGLEDVRAVSHGALKHVEHFDSKAAVTAYANESGIPLAVIEPGCYMYNMLGGMGPQRKEDGTLEWALPVSGDTVMSLLDPKADYGAFVRAAIESRSLGAGSTTLACAEEITLHEMNKQFTDITGRPCTYRQLSLDEYCGSDEILETLQFFERFGYFGRKDVKPSQAAVAELDIKLTKWADFVKKSDWSKFD